MPQRRSALADGASSSMVDFTNRRFVTGPLTVIFIRTESSHWARLIPSYRAHREGRDGIVSLTLVHSLGALSAFVARRCSHTRPNTIVRSKSRCVATVAEPHGVPRPQSSLEALAENGSWTTPERPLFQPTGHSRIKCGLDNVFCSHTPSPIHLGVCSRFRLPAPPSISSIHGHVPCRTNAASSAEDGQTTRRESQSQCHACDENTQRAPHPTGSGRRKGTLRPSFQDARWKGMPSRDVQLQTLISTSGF